jgi:hypothetical protein
MWFHFVNLLSKSWSRVLGALGTTTLSIVLFSLGAPIVVFIITMLVVWRTEGGVVDHLKKSAIPTLIALLVPFVLISFVFLWNTVRAVYDDHQDLVAQARSLSTKNDDLVDPTTRDAEIVNLKNQIEGYKKQESPAVRVYPISHDAQPGVPKLEFVMTTGKIRTPVEITATCDFPISSGNTHFMTSSGGHVQVTDHRRISDTEYKFVISSPAWTPLSPLWITILFSGKVDRMPSCTFKFE